MQAFWLALQFLTRLPTPHIAQVSPQAVGRSLLFYPLVGLIIGAILFAVAQMTVFISPMVSAAMVLALWLMLSGALHIDGLADMVDAWVGGHGDRERTLAIMKDPYCGPMGVTAVVVILLLKFAALVELTDSAPELLLMAPVLGRCLVLLLMLTTPYCREQGLASSMIERMPRRALWALLLLLAGVLLTLILWLGAMLLVGLLLLFAVYRRALMQRLGGYSGDGAGALIELGEVVTLMMGTVIITF